MSTDGPAEAPEKPAEAKAPEQEKHEDSFMAHFLHNLWAANTVTVTILSIVLAMIIGAILIIVSDPEVLNTFSYFTARPADALDASWTVVSNAYADLFKGAIVDPATVTAWFDGSGTWRQVFFPISETLTTQPRWSSPA